jgi:membrane fusion protein, multidrug efflux system
MNNEQRTEKPHMIRRMVIMLIIVCLLFGAIFSYQAFKAHMTKKYMASSPVPPVAVSAMKAELQPWQPQLNAVGSFRAVHGVDVTSEITGLVRTVHFKSGDNVMSGQLLVQLNADSDIAQLHSLQASAELARVVYERDKKQFAVKAVSKATLDADAADLKSKRAQVAQQQAIVEKKSIHAPFDGKLGISSVNPGQYINPGDKIVTLQSLDSIYVDFYLPQQDLSQISLGQDVTISTDTYPGHTFTGRIAAIDPKVDMNTRNFQVEVTIDNPKHELLPGMYATVNIQAGSISNYLTLPKTSIIFNPYGETVYVVEKKPVSPGEKPVLITRSIFITVGPTRGDQVAILKGIKEGDLVVTSGQLKLKSGSRVIINNQLQPSNDPSPKPLDQ